MMPPVRPFVDRLRAIVTSTVTYLVIVAAALPFIIDELVRAGVPLDHPVIHLLATAVAVLGVIIAILRRVTEVLPDARGLLDDGTPVTAREQHLDALVTELWNRPPGTPHPPAQ